MMNNLCKKCGGSLQLNLDGDLSCLMCGTVIVLTVRRQTDIQGIRKQLDTPIHTERVIERGMQRKKGQPRKFLGMR